MSSRDPQPLSSHLDDLKRCLSQILLILLLATCCSFTFSNYLISYLTIPLKGEFRDQKIEFKRFINSTSTPRIITLSLLDELHSHKASRWLDDKSLLIEPQGYAEIKVISEPSLALFSPAEGLILSLKLSFWMGLILSSPLWSISLFRFIAPALYPEEKQLVIPFAVISFLFMSLGALFAYKVTLPLTNSYFSSFNESIGVNFWGLGSYLDYAITLIAAHAVGFEAFIILLLLIQLDVISHEFLKGKRRHAIVISLLIGAILTPPDVLSQILLAIPLMAFYELAVLFASWRLSRKQDRSCRVDPTIHASH